MADLLFDTCVFIDFLGGDPQARAVVATTQGGGAAHRGLYSVWSILELLRRPGLTPDQQARRMALLTQFTALPITPEVATDATLLASDLRNGNPTSLLGDAIIAVTASNANATVITRNLADFALLKVAVNDY